MAAALWFWDIHGTPEESIQLAQEFLARAVRRGVFDMRDADRRDILVAQIESLTDRLPAESKAEIIRRLAASPRGKGHPRSWRNLLVVVAVLRLVAFGGLAMTRSEATRHRRSACSIVAEELTRLGVSLRERGVEDIMRRADPYRRWSNTDDGDALDWLNLS